MVHLHWRAAGLTLAFLLVPTAVFAKPAGPNPANTSAASAVPSTRMSWKADLPDQSETPLSGLARLSPFSERLAIGTSGSKSHEASMELGDATLSIGTVRSKSIRIDGLSSFAHRRFSSMEANLGIEMPVDSRNAIGFAGNWALERRRPAFVVAAHNKYQSLNQAITLSWDHDDRLRYALSAYRTKPLGNRSEAEQLVDFAAGGTRAARGIGFAVTSTPTRDPDRLAFGIALRQQHSAVDTIGGIPAFRPDSRVAFFVMERF